jgi:hypothetical protein
MFVLQCHIVIGSFTFDFVNQINVESTWKEQTDKATIILPAALRVDSNKLKNAIPKGSEVTIQIGYKDRLNTVFKGFVSRIRPKVPVEIECEDLMWKLKQIQINENAKNESMQSYLSRVLPYPVDCFDVHLPKFIASKVTGAQLLNQIKSDFGFPSFIRNGTIVVGKQYDPVNYSTHIVTIDNSKDSNVAQDGLEFTSKDDVKIKVTAISNMDSGEKIEIELGDPDGESRSLNFYNISKNDLQAIAEKEMARLRYDGYRGDLTIFGEPFVRHGDIMQLRNDQESDKTGRYHVDGVTYSFGTGGIRQSIKLGARL